MTKDEAIRFKDVDLSQQEVLECCYSSWYSIFWEFSVKSIIIKPLKPRFLQYLQDESIRLPDGVEELEINSDNEYSDWEQEQETEVEYFKSEEFQNLKSKIEQDIQQLGGCVAPKLNWSAPIDAAWVNAGNTIKCTSVNDILLLLKSSDHIMSDLQHPLIEVNDQDNEIAVSNGTIEYELVLRKWENINPALEFRVFIHNNHIIGISQRDLNHYIFLQELKPKFKSLIDDFVNKKVIPKFKLSKFIIDVYIPSPYNKVVIIDINPFSRKSDPLLFTWNELLTEEIDHNGQDYEFRLVNQQNLGRFAKKEYSENQVPLDMIDAAQNVDSLVELAREWSKLQVKQDENDDSDDK